MNLSKLVIKLALKIALIITGLILAAGSMFFGVGGTIDLFKGEDLGKYSPVLFALLSFFFMLFGISLFIGCLQLLRKEYIAVLMEMKKRKWG